MVNSDGEERGILKLTEGSTLNLTCRWIEVKQYSYHTAKLVIFECDTDTNSYEIMTILSSSEKAWHTNSFQIMTIHSSSEKAWQLEEVLKERIVIIDGAMGTMIQVIEYLLYGLF